MTDAKKKAQSDMPDVVHLAEKASEEATAEAATTKDSSPRAGAPAVERSVKSSLTPVFDAVVREWRAKGRDIPLRHKPAVPAQTRHAA
ncbi:hypothetical protein NGB36_05420 [Streptomyces sp. RB6PN25]|uniref:Uncharacterized protein n=1 Tax=Streptomyces humicola TaxID=2953240 RepID=A0ABT1PQU6_9ACTN|nr:hypothetical protein [Streptomyces humicola]MCQ4080046.1 hypothetical protein [Streptomyces humicola]